MRSSEARALICCPRCAGALDDSFHCNSCAIEYAEREGVLDLRVPLAGVSDQVRAFYSESPFPNYPPFDSLGWLRARSERSALLRLLDEAIPRDASVLDLGCGTGQAALFLASAGRTVIGADLTRASLELAASAARRYGVDSALFVETDLLAPGLRAGSFDVVHCSGVLHHTADPAASFAAAARLVRPGGVLLVGLYNLFARIPHRARRLLARLTGLRSALLDPVLRERDAEPERRKAWLRDQYLHPVERSHTVAELRGWYQANDFEWLRSFPSAQLGPAEPSAETMFESEDYWPPEAICAQFGWAAQLGHEGGLFFGIGCRRG